VSPDVEGETVAGKQAGPETSARAMVADSRFADLFRLALMWLIGTVVLALTAAVLPGIWSDHLLDYLWAALIIGLVGGIIRPVLVAVSARIGWLAVFLVAIAGQAVIVQIGLSLTPGIHVNSFWTAFAAAWIAAAVTTVVSWLFTAGTDEAYEASLVRHATRSADKVDDPEVDGVLFVQLDGVPYPVMTWALQSGLLPNINRWLRSGSHQLSEWSVQMPCTTPASQLGILHGSIDGVPAFRWYDRDLGRLLVANRPKDAAVIEERASDGRGLLADGGVSVSNLFTGDASRSAMTMSRLVASRGSAETRRAIAWYLARPDGFARSLSRTVAELVRERYQGARQVRRDVQPRVHRGWTFAFLRAVSNGVLRDLNIAVVVDEMRRGTRSIYVDYVDYDEIAHHAGMFRPESLVALDGVDTVLGCLRKIAESTPRKYHIVLLSDHGQSQGATFADRYGQDLAALVEELAAETVASVQEPVESWGRTEALLDDVASTDSMVVGRAAKSVRNQVEEGAPTLSEGNLVVLGSGNLGLVYARSEQRLTREDIDRQWPALLPGLAAHEGVGFVAVMAAAGPVAIGAEGIRWLESGEVEGIDPLADFGPHAPDNLLRAVLMEPAPDIYVNSIVDLSNLEVAAFEPLVGCHGGLGGWQDPGVFIAPTALMPDGPISGADEMHDVLVGMLERVGQRTDPAFGSPVDTEA